MRWTGVGKIRFESLGDLGGYGCFEDCSFCVDRKRVCGSCRFRVSAALLGSPPISSSPCPGVLLISGRLRPTGAFGTGKWDQTAIMTASATLGEYGGCEGVAGSTGLHDGTSNGFQGMVMRNKQNSAHHAGVSGLRGKARAWLETRLATT